MHDIDTYLIAEQGRKDVHTFARTFFTGRRRSDRVQQS